MRSNLSGDPARDAAPVRRVRGLPAGPTVRLHAGRLRRLQRIVLVCRLSVVSSQPAVTVAGAHRAAEEPGPPSACRFWARRLTSELPVRGARRSEHPGESSSVKIHAMHSWSSNPASWSTVSSPGRPFDGGGRPGRTPGTWLPRTRRGYGMASWWYRRIIVHLGDGHAQPPRRWLPSGSHAGTRGGEVGVGELPELALVHGPSVPPPPRHAGAPEHAGAPRVRTD